jgi:SlyX protein
VPQSTAEAEQRIVDLELRFMRAEKMIEDLNDVIVEQGRTIDRLALEVKTLREHAFAAEDPLKNERPPHY